MLLIKPFYLRAQAKKEREDVGVSFANLEAGTSIQGALFLLLMKMHSKISLSTLTELGRNRLLMHPTNEN